MNPRKSYTCRVMLYKIPALTDLEISIIHGNLGYTWHQRMMLLPWEPQLISQMAKLYYDHPEVRGNLFFEYANN